MINSSEMQTISIREYEEAISQLAERREPHLFYNEGNEHALVVFKTIFRNAKRNIYIVAKDLINKQVSNAPEYIDSLGGFLERNDVELNIMLTSCDPKAMKEAPLFKKIHESKAFRNGNVHIFTLNGKKFKDGDNVVHFCFADEQMYRIETDIENRKASVNFNDPSVVNGLFKNFHDGVSLDTTKEIKLSEIFQ